MSFSQIGNPAIQIDNPAGQIGNPASKIGNPANEKGVSGQNVHCKKCIQVKMYTDRSKRTQSEVKMYTIFLALKNDKLCTF